MTTRNFLRRFVAFCSLPVIAACTGGQSGILPSYQSVNIGATTKLQFAVGVANYAGSPALNTVATFRQANGLSATLLNTPSIVGPVGFVVPAGVSSAGNDSGSSNITSTPQALPGVKAAPTTFGQSGGVFAYGFAPLNSGRNAPGGYGAFQEPFYTDAASASFTAFSPLLGPPATSNFRDGITDPIFPGYPSGFTSFLGVTLVPGQYTLNVLIPAADPKLISNLTATANLVSTAMLPTFTTPVFASDTTGGGSISLTVPSGVTETIVYLSDGTSGLTYSFFVTGSGPQTITVPDNIGKISPKGATSATLGSGDSVSIVAVGFDYPAFEAAPPSNHSQTPTIVGPNGQADLTASAAGMGTE